ncbi:MAG: membrane protein insertase YidC [Xanthomonadales bacterium]|nr:membrane protein insertase YidC [Gammaproteobacteria bacterium]NNK51005.1 membrane protein insertase YidC [Xanthomonadales bacterium]
MFHRIFAFVLLLSACGAAAAATQVNTDSLRLTFDASGNMQSALACFPACTGENARVQQFGDASVIRFEGAGAGAWSQTESHTQTHYELTFRQGAGARLTWRIPVNGYRIELQHAGIAGITLQSGESFRPREAAGFGNWLEQSRYVILNSGDAVQVALQDTDVTSQQADQWLGFRNRYWTLMAAPPSSLSVKPETADEMIDARISVNLIEGEWSFYIGPIEPSLLARASPELSNLLYAGLWFWLRWICFALFHLLAIIHLAIPSWGLSIMVLSVAVNILMTPLSRIADRFQDQVNDTEARLAPELQRIKQNFKGEEQAAKILALYKTERVHPLYSLKSLMGVAVVIPVFIGAFDMLAENIHLLHTGFLWISDLSRPDDLFNLPFMLPFFGNEFNALPFLMTGLSVVASSLHNPPALTAGLRKKQVRNMLLLAAAFFVLFYTFPAGMVLYWTTNNLISVSKSLWSRR